MLDNYEKKLTKTKHAADVSEWGFNIDLFDKSVHDRIVNNVVTEFLGCIDLSAIFLSGRKNVLDLTVQIGLHEGISTRNPRVVFDVSAEIEYLILDYKECSNDPDPETKKLKSSLAEVRIELERLAKKIELSLKG